MSFQQYQGEKIYLYFSKGLFWTDATDCLFRYLCKLFLELVICVNNTRVKLVNNVFENGGEKNAYPCQKTGDPNFVGIQYVYE